MGTQTNFGGWWHFFVFWVAILGWIFFGVGFVRVVSKKGISAGAVKTKKILNILFCFFIIFFFFYFFFSFIIVQQQHNQDYRASQNGFFALVWLLVLWPHMERIKERHETRQTNVTQRGLVVGLAKTPTVKVMNPLCGSPLAFFFLRFMFLCVFI